MLLFWPCAGEGRGDSGLAARLTEARRRQQTVLGGRFEDGFR